MRENKSKYLCRHKRIPVSDQKWKWNWDPGNLDTMGDTMKDVAKGVDYEVQHIH